MDVSSEESNAEKGTIFANLLFLMDITRKVSTADAKAGNGPRSWGYNPVSIPGSHF